jgi:hypothetical protein
MAWGADGTMATVLGVTRKKSVPMIGRMPILE